MVANHRILKFWNAIFLDKPICFSFVWVEFEIQQGTAPTRLGTADLVHSSDPLWIPIMLYSGHSDFDPGVRSAWIKTYTFIEIPDHNWLVVWDMICFPYTGNVIIPTDELIYFFHRSRSTTNQIYNHFLLFWGDEQIHQSELFWYAFPWILPYLLPGCHRLVVASQVDPSQCRLWCCLASHAGWPTVFANFNDMAAVRCCFSNIGRWMFVFLGVLSICSWLVVSTIFYCPKYKYIYIYMG